MYIDSRLATQQIPLAERLKFSGIITVIHISSQRSGRSFLSSVKMVPVSLQQYLSTENDLKAKPFYLWWTLTCNSMDFVVITHVLNASLESKKSGNPSTIPQSELATWQQIEDDNHLTIKFGWKNQFRAIGPIQLLEVQSFSLPRPSPSHP